jgi:hypothetical protein
VYDDSWKVCLDCSVTLVENAEADDVVNKALIGSLDEIDKGLFKAGGGKLILAGEHNKIAEVLKEVDVLDKEISDEFHNNHPDAINLYWILRTVFAHLTYIDTLINVQLQNEGEHSRGCQVILAVLPLSHGLLSNPEKYGKMLSISKSQKVREIASKVVEHLNNFHNTVYAIEHSLQNIVKLEAEAKKK